MILSILLSLIGEILLKIENYTNQNVLLFIWVFANLIAIFILSFFVNGKNKLVNYLDKSLKKAKRSKDEASVKLYQQKKVNHQTWFFILHSIIMFIIYCLTPILFFGLEYLLQNAFQLNNSYNKLFWTTFIVFVGLMFVGKVSRQKNPTFRTYGQCIVILNTSMIALLTFCFFDQLDQQDDSDVGLLSILVFYFNCVNISAFISYGYDSSIAWLFPKSEEPTHWLQRLFGWLDLKYKIKQKLAQRIPEPILHWHSACGGTIGAYCGHLFFKHKMRGQESKRKFAPIFKGTALTQTLMLIGLFIVNLL
ncbi:MAG: DUF1294 domain-containing protein [Symploca sp. SIO1B1]|nr:DUF1294 domain-containing protein [Symploca sp. SIO1B1]